MRWKMPHLVFPQGGEFGSHRVTPVAKDSDGSHPFRPWDATCYILFMILMWISVTRCYKYHCCGCYSLLLNHCHVRHCQYVYICLSVCVICMIPWFYDSLCVCIIYWIINVLCTVYKPKTCVWCQAVLNMVMSWDELHMLHRYRLAKNVKSKEWCAFPGCLSL